MIPLLTGSRFYRGRKVKIISTKKPSIATRQQHFYINFVNRTVYLLLIPANRLRKKSTLLNQLLLCRYKFHNQPSLTLDSVATCRTVERSVASKVAIKYC